MTDGTVLLVLVPLLELLCKWYCSQHERYTPIVTYILTFSFRLCIVLVPTASTNYILSCILATFYPNENRFVCTLHTTNVPSSIYAFGGRAQAHCTSWTPTTIRRDMRVFASRRKWAPKHFAIEKKKTKKDGKKRKLMYTQPAGPACAIVLQRSFRPMLALTSYVPCTKATSNTTCKNCGTWARQRLPLHNGGNTGHDGNADDDDDKNRSDGSNWTHTYEEIKIHQRFARAHRGTKT